jgi:hypothetical protein
MACQSTVFDATPWMREYAAFRSFELATLDACAAQRRVLGGLLSRATATKFGKDHGFRKINTVEEFQRTVPLRCYEDLHRDYWQHDFPKLRDCTWPGLIPYYALSSGTTTGKAKYIPCSRETLFDNARSAHDVLVHHVLNRPVSRVLGGKCLLLGGSTALAEEAPGIYSGDLSGIEACEVPWWEAPWVFPPKELALIADWEEKIERLARAAVQEDIRAISGAPNWLQLFFEKLFDVLPGDERLARIFENLELIIHGGINIGPYRKRFNTLLEASHAETRETYVASEGFMALADVGADEGMRLQLDGGVFFEFVPVADLGSGQRTRHWMGTVETGVEYAIVVSTCSGLWADLLGDTVRFVSLNPPRIVVTGRTTYVLSAVGEHLIAEEIERAICGASSVAGVTVADYSVGSIESPRATEPPNHLYIIELAEPTDNSQWPYQFCRAVDQKLSNLNDDYAAHRAHDFGLKPPEILVVPAGTFSQWMKRRGKLGGQNKVPRIINDPHLFADLRSFASSTSGQRVTTQYSIV